MFLDAIIKHAVETSGPRFTQTTLTLDSVSLSMFSGVGTLRGLVLGNPPGCRTEFAVKVDRTELSVQPGSVLADKLHVRHLRLLAPEINFEGGLAENNLSRILDNLKSATSAGHAAKSSGTIKKLQVDEFAVTAGTLHVTTALTSSRPLTVALPDVRFTNLGQGPDGLTPADLAERLVGELYRRALAAARQCLGAQG